MTYELIQTLECCERCRNWEQAGRMQKLMGKRMVGQKRTRRT